MSTFDELVSRMTVLAARHHMRPFDPEARRWRFEIPIVAWEIIRDHVRSVDGWAVSDPPLRGEARPYLMLGYPFVVDPNLPDDGLRLVERP